jgi:hypothetical protein
MIRVYEKDPDNLVLMVDHFTEPVDRVFAMNLAQELDDWLQGKGEFLPYVASRHA